MKHGMELHAGFPQPRCMSGVCGQPFLQHKFKGNKSMKILIQTIYVILENGQGQYFSILIKLPNNEMS